jgi:hypothetical protein
LVEKLPKDNVFPVYTPVIIVVFVEIFLKCGFSISSPP